MVVLITNHYDLARDWEFIRSPFRYVFDCDYSQKALMLSNADTIGNSIYYQRQKIERDNDKVAMPSEAILLHSNCKQSFDVNKDYV